MTDKELIKKVKILKAMESIDNYYEIAEMLEMSTKSFYNWLNGYYSLGQQKKNKLRYIVSDLYIPE